MKIRAIRATDLPVLTEMAVEFERFIVATEGKRRKIDAAKMRADLEAGGFGRRKFFVGLMAQDNDSALGFLLYHLGFNASFNCGTLFVSSLYVRKSARGLGVGEALMRRAMDIARTQGCGRIEWTVWNINAAAIGFYVGLGAKPVDDELIMGLQLAK